MTTPTITPHNDIEVKVEFDYRKEAVEQIKADIPGPGRKWNAGNKCWLVHNDFADYASDIMMAVFGKVDVHPEVTRRIQAIRKHEEGGQIR